VIPKLTFTQQMRFSKSEGKFDIRARSPGPNLYRPKSAAVLSRAPIVTIGNTKRWNKKERVLSAQQPGPSTYKVKTLLKRNPSAVIGSGMRLHRGTTASGPGPSDYNVSFN
jgi:hypothetical protein